MNRRQNSVERLIDGAGLPWQARRLDRERRPLLEEAVIEEVVDLGYAGATVGGVCRRAGVSSAEFGAQFEDIEDAYCEVLDGLIGQLLEHLFLSFVQEHGWRQRIRTTAYAFFDFIDSDRRRAKFMFVEIYFAGERAQRMRTEGTEIVTDLIDQVRHQLEDPSKVTRATAQAVAGAMLEETKMIIKIDDPRAYDRLPGLIFAIVAPYLGFEKAQEELEIVPPQSPAYGDRHPAVF